MSWGGGEGQLSSIPYPSGNFYQAAVSHVAIHRPPEEKEYSNRCSKILVKVTKYLFPFRRSKDLQ